ncbi:MULTISPECIES: antibiotic biosynthesis monooxygenase [Streptomyces]|uniref:antibiotic biosynthesis monooxygenase n=1 Tax=Streptomyces TaxID=1883 RepID=UPI00167C0199|nr:MULTISPECIES: antibiotic biosynthesis monooxygenase [Streptomyces]MBK3527229.1 antibiotic biosynthesis monooxygenase [Streptomyces sp. MBT70]
MTTRLQDLQHPSAGTTLMSEWLTGTAERSRTAADALLHEWAAAPAPSGRLAQHVFLSLDGTGLFFYAQWTSDEEHLAWARARRTEVVSRVDALVPGIERPGLVRTRLARSVVHDARRPAGLITVRTVVAGDVETATAPAPGLLAAHLHVTSDGERTVVVTEWADAASQEAAAGGEAGVKRYTHAHSFVDHAGPRT